MNYELREEIKRMNYLVAYGRQTSLLISLLPSTYIYPSSLINYNYLQRLINGLFTRIVEPRPHERGIEGVNFPPRPDSDLRARVAPSRFPLRWVSQKEITINRLITFESKAEISNSKRFIEVSLITFTASNVLHSLNR